MSGNRQRRGRGPVIAVAAAAALIALMVLRPVGPIPLLLLGGVAALALIIGVSGGGSPTAGLAQPHAAPTGRPRPSARAAAPAPKPSRRERWDRARTRHDEVLSEYGAYELDPEMLLRFPAMWDLGAEKVMAFHDALDHAGALRTDDFPGDTARADEYAEAVTDLRAAWFAADRYARSTGVDNLAPEDARDLDRGLKLYRHAQAAQAAERAAYLDQVVSTVDRLVDRGVITRTPALRAELESRARKAIEG
ncbi:hypothetical protein GCM10009551_090460 [Nocardiopsis tropica]|uniref:hypothetical protein n=1 Tax=Tsukamurella strandjordii TaxID=147577 RepID=UPI0031D65748